MKNQRLKLTINLMVILCALSVSLTSFLYLTYSWFTFTGTQNTNVMAITAEDGMQCDLKYFVKNYIGLENVSGYPSPASFLVPGNRVTVDNYATDFAPIAQDPMMDVNQRLRVTAQYPGLRFTYALEINGVFSEDKVIQLLVGNYSAPPSTTLYDSGTQNGITLAKAINIYATAIDASGNLTTQANTFVTNLTPVDAFNRIAPYGPSNISLAYGDFPQNTEKVIFLFTVEFSNLSDSFYKYASTSNGKSYYTPNTLGDSNVYKGLGFEISLLQVHVTKAS